jgi:DNA-binding MarR family transcriptional regulator
MSETTQDVRADASAAVEDNIAHIYQAAKARIKSLAVRFHPDLQPVGYGILRLVFEGEPLRASDIAVTLGMDKGAVSRQVAALREMGLVDTRSDPDDGRATLLVATPTAREGLAAFRSESSSDYGRVFADWSTAELRDFAALLTKFNTSVDGLRTASAG